ncbi:MAG: PTS sugar transporter subunit IIA [Spirochaetales bacterium]|nr:PTS sugar transporter subunit IIA [Spirochaetales bacterium]
MSAQRQDALWQILDPGCIELALKARRKEEALAELAGLLARAGRIADPEELTKALVAREKLTSTGIGAGIAIPHAMLPGLQETILAIGRKPEGLPFDALDRKPVQLIFLLAGPPGRELVHLQLLSRLARLLRDPTFREALMSAATPQEVLELLREREEEA